MVLEDPLHEVTVEHGPRRGGRRIAGLEPRDERLHATTWAPDPAWREMVITGRWAAGVGDSGRRHSRTPRLRGSAQLR